MAKQRFLLYPSTGSGLWMEMLLSNTWINIFSSATISVPSSVTYRPRKCTAKTNKWVRLPKPSYIRSRRLRASRVGFCIRKSRLILIKAENFCGHFCLALDPGARVSIGINRRTWRKTFSEILVNAISAKVFIKSKAQFIASRRWVWRILKMF